MSIMLTIHWPKVATDPLTMQIQTRPRIKFLLCTLNTENSKELGDSMSDGYNIYMLNDRLLFCIVDIYIMVYGTYMLDALK